MASEYEHTATRIRCDKMDAAMCRAFAKLVLPPGRRGRVCLVLDSPYNARALAALAFLLARVED